MLAVCPCCLYRHQTGSWSVARLLDYLGPQSSVVESPLELRVHVDGHVFSLLSTTSSWLRPRICSARGVDRCGTARGGDTHSDVFSTRRFAPPCYRLRFGIGFFGRQRQSEHRERVKGWERGLCPRGALRKRGLGPREGGTPSRAAERAARSDQSQSPTPSRGSPFSQWIRLRFWRRRVRTWKPSQTTAPTETRMTMISIGNGMSGV